MNQRPEDKQQQEKDGKPSKRQGSALARMDKATLIKFGGLIAFFLLLVVVCVAIAPLIKELTQPGGLQRVTQEVRNAGPAGVFVLFGMQLLQVIVAFIPGEVVQVAAGLMYGTWGGAAIILAGCVVSSSAIFFIVHKLGAPFVRAMIPRKAMDKLEAFEQTDKLNTMVFVLFLIPGIPKDILTYLVPLTAMPLSRFVVLANVGRIPGVVASTMAADGLIQGDYLKSAILFVACAIVAVVAIVSYEKILRAFARRKKDK